MHTDPTHGEVVHHKPKHLAERFEGLIGVVMVAAIILLAIGLVFGLMTTGPVEPKWMQ